MSEAAKLGCEKCNYTGVLAGKLGGKWTYYPQIKCACAARAESTLPADRKE